MASKYDKYADRIKTLYEEGSTLTEVSRFLNIPPKSIRLYLRKADLLPPSREKNFVTEAEKAEMVRLFKKEANFQKIGIILNRDTALVRKHLNSLGYQGVRGRYTARQCIDYSRDKSSKRPFERLDIESIKNFYQVNDLITVGKSTGKITAMYPNFVILDNDLKNSITYIDMLVEYRRKGNGSQKENTG